MLPRQNRLSRGEFVEVAAMPVAARNELGVCKVRQGPIKCGVVISKKAVKTAPARHRLRRRAYAAFEKVIGNRNLEVAWYLTPTVGTLPFRELCEKLDDMLTIAWSKARS